MGPIGTKAPPFALDFTSGVLGVGGVGGVGVTE